MKLNAGNILVGPNNSGKSSILDAFRILEACLRHAKTRNPVIIEIENHGIFNGYEIQDNIIPFSLANITHNYNDEDSIIEFRGSNKVRAVIRLHPERQTKFYLIADGLRVKTSSKFRNAVPVDLVIVPTLGPLEADELYVADQTVQRNTTTRLASRVLRNIWLRRSKEEFDAFCLEVESAWPSIRLQQPQLRPTSQPAIVEMFYSEDRIDREVQWAGFGFQVWLQIQTHLRRGGSSSTLIIDEPDIYLHSDLQRRLLRGIRSRFSQFVMATHAVEIINDAEPDDVVSINPKYKSGKRFNTDEDFSSL